VKIAVIYNRDSKSVINLFGIPNREKYGKKSIARIVDCLKQYGHQVQAFEGDKDLISNLESFMPKVLKGERPGMAFNLSYGIQGQARYTHVPGILEMVGIPYVGSNPLAHSLALDKVVAKMIFRQHGLPTPDFAVLSDPDFTPPDLQYPLIVKPKNEAVSMGIRIVNNLDELREAARVIFETFLQPALVEQYIEGREINVGLLGNDPPEVLPPCEITFGGDGPAIYTIEDKKGKSGRKIDWICPAPLDEALTKKAKEIALGAFKALQCYDMARVDMRLDKNGNLYLLEINSLPSLGEHGSYTIAAKHIGLDFPALVNRMVEVAGARYFGAPKPSVDNDVKKDPKQAVFSFITDRRDDIERSLEKWVNVSSRTSDPVGNQSAVQRLGTHLEELAMLLNREFTDERSVWTWETKAGLEGGTLFLGHLDIPLSRSRPEQAFRREPEWLFGEGIGVSRAPLVMLEYALRALRNQRLLRGLPLGVLYYLDEGRDARYSHEIITAAATRAKRVIVLRPSGPLGNVITQRRGQRKYQLTIEGEPLRLGKQTKRNQVLLWAAEKVQALAALSSRAERIALSAIEVKTDAFPMLLPHRINTTLLLSYLDEEKAQETEEKMNVILHGGKFKISLETISDRPPMREKRGNVRLAKSLAEVAAEWEIPVPHESSVWPSVGGLVPGVIPVICGIGPAARDLYTPQEAVSRVSLVQRTLLLAQFLVRNLER